MEGLAVTLRGQVLAERNVELLLEGILVDGASILDQPIYAGSDGRSNLLDQVSPRLDLAHWLPHRLRNLDVKGDVATRSCEPEAFEAFTTELVERTIHSKDKRVLIYGCAVSACYVRCKQARQGNLEVSDQTRLRASLLATD